MVSIRIKKVIIFICLILVIGTCIGTFLFFEKNIPYELIGNFKYAWGDGEILEEVNYVKEESAFMYEFWYGYLKDGIEKRDWSNRDYGIGNNGYATIIEEGGVSYIAVTPGSYGEKLRELKVKRIYEKDDKIIIDLKTVTGMDLSLEYRVLFIKVRTSKIEGKPIIVHKNEES